jgi:hypothetical protein
MVFPQTHTPCAGRAFVEQVDLLVGFGILFLGDGWDYFTGVATVIGLMSGVGVGP